MYFCWMICSMLLVSWLYIQFVLRALLSFFKRELGLSLRRF